MVMFEKHWDKGVGQKEINLLAININCKILPSSPPINLQEFDLNLVKYISSLLSSRKDSKLHWCRDHVFSSVFSTWHISAQ